METAQKSSSPPLPIPLGRVGAGYTSSNSSAQLVVPSASATDQFPVGLRVLVVDDDTTCLRILEHMLRKCLYHVTTCCQAIAALNLLREKKGCFDVVISDVHMPDMDGFKLLEHVGLEMDLPVIMMSADGRTSAVMRGIKHGACDYLIKPVRLEELKNIWQHVIRKKWNGSRDLEQSGSVEETAGQKRGGDDIEYASSANEGTDGSWRVNKKRKDAKEDDDGDLDNDDPSSSKKPRVVWSVELHQQFVSAVNQLGIDKAVPKRILELMNVPGLTRENVASHLQKFRLYLKRLSGVAQQGSGIPNVYYGPGEANAKFSGVDIQALAACGQIPAQTLAAIHAEVFGRPTGGLGMDKSVALQASLQGTKCTTGVAFGQPHIIPKQFPQVSNIPAEDILSAVGTWMPNNLSTMSNHGGLRQQLQLQQQQKHQSVFPESSHTISVQPSCVVVPSNFQSVSMNQSCSTFSSSKILSSQSHNNVWGQVPEGDGAGYCFPVSISTSVLSSCSGQTDNISSWQVQMDSSAAQAQGSNTWGVHPACTSKRDQIGGQKLGFVGKGTTSVPSRFVIDDFDGGCVKQEVLLDHAENAKVGMPVIQQYSSSDLLLT